MLCTSSIIRLEVCLLPRKAGVWGKSSPCPSFLNDIQLIRKGKDDMLSPSESDSTAAGSEAAVFSTDCKINPQFGPPAEITWKSKPE